ncbi:MAG: xanthine dehydrogenase family protein molybdopterin-binding subunit [Acidimicrobiia bacterium]|nr:xanthine dehydrogenase family protein molybdopterin-binding subunit [Acidimicrobiia bacterium]
MSILGNRVRRVEDPRFLTGAAQYCADLHDPLLDGALHATFVRSTQPHAIILGIDVDGAVGQPGVVGVYTGADVDLDPLPPGVPGLMNAAMVRPLLARDRVRFVGEPVAVVVSETPAQGVDAIEAVWPDYEPLPVVVDPEDAAGDEVILHPDAGTNLVVEFDFGRDEELFAACEVVVRQRLVNQRVAGVPMEGRSAAVAWDEAGRLHMFISTQNAHGVRDALVGVYGLDAAAVRVIAPDVGGGFGPKIGGSAEELLLPWLARRSGRPVRWTESRSENLVGMGQGRAQVQFVEIGGRRDGTVEAYRLSVLQDAGAYPAIGAFLPYFTRMMAPATYAFPKVECNTSSVVTNTTPTVAYRGAGRPEATAAAERAVDLFAAELGLDPVEVRRRNLVPAFAEAYTTPVATSYDTGDYGGALDRVLEAAGYDGLRAEQARRRDAGDPVALGIGVSTYVEITAGPTAGEEYARVEVVADGSVLVHSGSSAHGQGHATAFAMVASEELGIPVERITVVQGDTDVIPKGVGTFGSRSLQLGGTAVHKATIEVVERARGVAAELLEAAADDVVLDKASGAFHVAGTPSVTRTWSEVAAAAGLDLAAAVDFTAAQPTYPFGAHVAVVEVDTETGDVRLQRLVACDDAGRIVNPLLAEGQRHGGIAQGVAQALYEEVRYDADGNPLTTNLADYAMISAAELPSFELVDMATPSWVNPLGAKGIGESGTIGSTPAVQSAVCDALAHLGVRHIDIPCSPERVWLAIQSAAQAG